MSELTLSPQQTAAIEFVTKKRRNLTIKAVAGAGKTFTLFQIARKLFGGVVVMAYSKNISIELEDKAGKLKSILDCTLDVGTVHRFGLRTFTRHFGYNGKKDAWKVKIMKKTEKCDLLMKQVHNRFTGETGVPAYFQAFVRKAYILARQWGVAVDGANFTYGNLKRWLELVDHFDLEELLIQDEDNPPEDMERTLRDALNWTRCVLELGVDRAMQRSPVPDSKYAVHWIDFEDMIYIPLMLNMKPQKFDVVMVDEAQDLNLCRILIAGRFTKPDGRLIFVGDPYQAIFGFTGADSESLNTIQKTYDTEELPLSVSFRCAQNVVKFVQQWVPHIEASPTAPEGISPLLPEGRITEEDLWTKDLTKDDAILCRNNAPLVDLFFKCVVKDIPCHIEGRDIGADLIRTVNKFPRVQDWTVLYSKLSEWREKQIQKYMDKGKEEKAERVADVVDAVLAIMDRMPSNSTVRDLRFKIEHMFQSTEEGKKPDTLTLTTSHKAKGREWTRVFWYGRNLYNPSAYAKKEWQMQQETNLMYVAGTRAKLELYDVFVESKVSGKKNGKTKKAD